MNRIGVGEHDVKLVTRPTANGETVECYFTVDGAPLYSDVGVGGWCKEPVDAGEAFRAALRAATRSAVQESGSR